MKRYHNSGLFVFRLFTPSHSSRQVEMFILYIAMRLKMHINSKTQTVVGKTLYDEDPSVTDSLFAV